MENINAFCQNIELIWDNKGFGERKNPILAFLDCLSSNALYLYSISYTTAIVLYLVLEFETVTENIKL